MTVRQTGCKHCGQDIEGFSPYGRGKWRDRGGNTTCPNEAGDQGQKHEPIDTDAELRAHDREVKRASEPTQALTQVEFSEADFDVAERVARRLGYEQTAYTSTSALWGLFCLPENPATAKRGQATRGACIIKTRELGFLVVQDLEDLHLDRRTGRPEGVQS